ncbi:MAG: ATP-binding cassette domain-containing protein [Chitinophagaceae bacterium]|nr:ATP-binding cassette domain-containing protein [Chitinophagaceae bacterium]MBL0057438.1 ATP-binding cassette domain-containing protein [Chitinophagaceae bacterium]
MQIELRQVVPLFIEEEKITGSGLWKNDLEFTPAERVQIVAPSGSGKTSLIHFLYGMRKDFSGTIAYDGENINSLGAEKLATYRQKHLSIVFQDLRLFTGQTVLENLEIKRALHPYHTANPIETMARRLGIHNKLGKISKTCSYGEQQRIAIIRSLLQPFDFLLLDEPFSHLDDNNRKKAMELMEEEAHIRKAAIILADLKPTSFYQPTRTINL